jgi:hypothetical protein
MGTGIYTMTEVYWQWWDQWEAGGSECGRFGVGELVWWGKYKRSGHVLPPATAPSPHWSHHCQYTSFQVQIPVPISSHLHTSYPVFEDGTDRWFRNVGIQKSDAGDTPKILLTIFKTRRKFGIKK